MTPEPRVTPSEDLTGSLYMIDGDVWRVCLIDEEGAELHRVNHWQTRGFSPSKWRDFTEANKPIGRYE